MKRLLQRFLELLNRRPQSWLDKDMRSWRQANLDAKMLVWNKGERRWLRRSPLTKWEGETAGIEA